MDGYEYECFEMSLIPILVGKVLSDTGREEEYLKGIGASEIITDDYYSYIMEGLISVCDFWEGREVGPYMDSCWFFSDRDMMGFYRLCRDWSRQRGIPLRRNPYMEQAERELNEQLDSINSWFYTYRFSTKVNHKWASGITIYLSPEFNQEFSLLKALAYIFDYYRRMAKELRYELWKYDREQKAKVLYLPLPKPEIWKEAA
ncbi:hypothetical protein D1157_16170 [Anaerotruncus sp. X29]|nr:hypothetical protein [Anaerotruncus sp. X29]